MLKQPRIALWYEQGLGKTITALAAMDEMPMLTLVICPKSIMRGAWGDDAEHFPDLSLHYYHGFKRKRDAVWWHVKTAPEDVLDCTVVVTTYETFRLYRDDLKKLGFRRMVVDEASRMKNRKAKSSQAMIEFADGMESVVLMTGTPAPNGPEEYYAQIRAIYGPRTPSFYTWAGKYMNAIMKTVPGRRRPVVDRYILREPEPFAVRLERMAHVKKKIDCFKDMVPKVERNVWVSLTTRERWAYNIAQEELLIEIGDGNDEFAIESSAVTMKLRQIVGGNVRNTAEKTWNRVGNSKLKALADLVEGFGSKPFLVWTQFHAEADRVSELLADLGIEHRICDGRSTTLDWFVEEFKRGDVRCLVCHPQTIGHGATLIRSGDQYCSDAIYYSMSFSLEYQLQSMDRIHRIGQMETCSYWFLLAENTIDETMRAAVKEKQKVSERVLSEMRAIAYGRQQARKGSQ